MKRILLDTDVLLDVLSKRHPFYEPAARILSLSEKKLGTLCATPLTLSNIHYILSKQLGKEATRESLINLTSILEIIPVDQKIVIQSLVSDFADFEDGIQYYAAMAAAIEVVITRDLQDFRSSALPVMSPAEYLASLSPPHPWP